MFKVVWFHTLWQDGKKLKSSIGGGVAAILRLLLCFEKIFQIDIFPVAYWWFMCYNTLRRTMSNASEIYRLESHLESMILMNDSNE